MLFWLSLRTSNAFYSICGAPRQHPTKYELKGQAFFYLLMEDLSWKVRGRGKWKSEEALHFNYICGKVFHMSPPFFFLEWGEIVLGG